MDPHRRRGAGATPTTGPRQPVARRPRRSPPRFGGAALLLGRRPHRARTGATRSRVRQNDPHTGEADALPGQLEAVEHDAARRRATSAGSVVGAGQLADLGAGEERRRADLHRDVRDAPALGDHRLGDLGGQAGRRARRARPVGDVALERLLAAARPGHARLADDRRRRRRRGRAACRCGPIVGPNRRGQLVVVGARPARRRSWTPSSASRRAVRSPMPQIAVTGRSPMRRPSRSARVEPGDAAGLGEAGGRLGLSLRLADADRARQPGRREDPRLIDAASASGSSVARADERLVPAPHLDDHRERPQRGHHLAPTPRRRPAGRTAGTRRRGTARAAVAAACPSARRTPGPRTTPWPRPAGAGRGLPSPPTTTGRPASSGRRSTSTAARNWSRSTWRIQSRAGP